MNIYTCDGSECKSQFIAQLHIKFTCTIIVEYVACKLWECTGSELNALSNENLYKNQ